MDVAQREKRTANLASLEIALGKPALLTALGFDEWVREDEEPQSREKLLRRTIWGSIIWSQSIGRPATSRLAQGFVVEHLVWDPTASAVDTGGGILVGGAWGAASTPYLWDGPADPDLYRVDFFTRGRFGLTNRIKVTMSQVNWTSVPVLDLGAGYYHLVDALKQFDMMSDEPTVFAPVTVQWARALGPGNHVPKRWS